jgi:hypothetical protein
LIVQLLGECCGLAEEVEAPSGLPKCKERRVKIDAEIDALREEVTLHGETLGSEECLLKTGHGLPKGWPRHGLLPRLSAVCQGLVPHLAPQSMVGQPFDLVRSAPRSHLGHAVPSERFEGLDNAGMQRPPPFLEKAAIGDLVRQGVLEGVLALGKEARLIEELSGLEVGEAPLQTRFGQLGNGLQEEGGHLVPDDRCGLEQAFLLGRQSVDARRQHRQHRRRHLQADQRLLQAISPAFAD